MLREYVKPSMVFVTMTTEETFALGSPGCCDGGLEDMFGGLFN
ncbi:MAG: hypothetical protein ACM3UZ_14865 [Acidobacteriota bacterium]